jgi:hypothetical protein
MEERRRGAYGECYIIACNQVLCSLLFFCQSILFNYQVITWHLSSWGSPTYHELLPYMYPFFLFDSGEMFSIFFQDNPQFGPYS